MKPFTLALVAIISCALGVSARAATLETSAGKTVPEGQVSAELIQAVTDFEKNSLFVVDGVSNNIIDVFVRKDFYSLLGYSTIAGAVFSDSNNLSLIEFVRFPICAALLTRLEIDAKTGMLECNKNLSSSLEVATFLSVRWMARTEGSKYKFSSLDAGRYSGTLYLTFDSRNYIMRFKITPQDMVTRRKTLENLRSMVKEQRRVAEEKRLAAAQIQAARLKLRAEEVRRRAEAQRPALEAQLKTIVRQTIMLDGVLALPVKSVVAFAGWFARTHENRCIEVSASKFEDYYTTPEQKKTVCDDSAWMTTNYVPLKLVDKLYVPVPVLAELFSHVEFRHDLSLKTLNLRLANDEGIFSAFKLALPFSLPAHRTVTQARIFKFTKDSAPKCSTAKLMRSTYTATIGVGDDEEFSHLILRLSNTSITPVSIIWGETLLRLSDGQHRAVAQSPDEDGSPYQSQSPTVVAPKTSRSAILRPALTKVGASAAPTDPNYYAKLFDITAKSDWKRNSLVVTGATATVSGVLAVRVNAKKVFENFSVTCTTKPGEYRR